MSGFPGFDVDAAARRINEENRREDAKASVRKKAAREEARRLAGAFRAKDPGIAAVWGFGSTFDDTRPYRVDSDIDLAIEGGDALALISTTLDSEFKVDVVDITGADDAFARSIRASGVPL